MGLRFIREKRLMFLLRELKSGYDEMKFTNGMTKLIKKNQFKKLKTKITKTNQNK